MGGLRAEFFYEMATLFSIEHGLFRHANDAHTLVELNPSSNFDNAADLQYEFAGRILGLAVFHNNQIDAQFSPLVFKSLLGLEPNLEDLNLVDPSFYKSLVSLR